MPAADPEAPRGSPRRAPRWGVWPVLALWAALVWIWGMEGPTGPWRYPLLNSDFLQPAFIVRDLFSSWEGFLHWTWPDAPRFFPDFLLHVLFWPLAPNLLANTLLPTLVLQAAIVGTLYAWARRASGVAGGSLAVAVYGASMVLLLANALRPVESPEILFWLAASFRSWHHGGTAVVAFFLHLCLAVDLSYPRAPARGWRTLLRRLLATALLGLVAGLTTFSDSSLMLYFVAPALFSVVLLRLLVGVPAARARRWLVVGAVALASYVLLRRLYVPRRIAVGSRLDQLHENLETARRTLQLVWHEDAWGLSVIAVGLFVAAAVGATALWRHRRRTPGPGDTMWLAFAVTLTAAAFFNLLAGAPLGFIHAGHSLRYLPMVYLTAVAVPGSALARWWVRRPRRAARPDRLASWLLGTALAASLATVVAIAAQPERWTRHFGPDPDTRCVIEALADAPRPRWGLSTYWQARPLEFHSGSSLRTAVVDREGKLSITVTDLADALPPVGGDERAWPPFSFAVLDGKERVQARRTYPRPSRRTTCGPYELWEFDEPHGLLKPLFSDRGLVIDRLAKLRGRLVLPAAMIPGAGRLDGWSREGAQDVVSGPGWRGLRGRYEIEIEMTVCCVGDPGRARWEVEHLPYRTLARGSLPPAAAPQVARATVGLGDPERELMIRVGGRGVQSVAVHWITLTPLRSPATGATAAPLR